VADPCFSVSVAERHNCRSVLADDLGIGQAVSMRGMRSGWGAVLVAAIWLATSGLLIHWDEAPVPLKMALWIGVPLCSGIVVPASWRPYVFVLAVPLLLATFLLMEPWNGTTDTPPGSHWTQVTFAVAVITVAIQCVGFSLGLGIRAFASYVARSENPAP
jgi:hypothetical protein